MGKESVDIVISAYDEASKVITPLQARINDLFGQTPQGFAPQMEKQFDARAAMEDQLFELTHSAKETELRDSERYFSQLREQWSDNQSMLTLIEQNELASRKDIETKYAENSLATFRKWRSEYIGIIRSVIVARLAIHGLSGITEAIITNRDKGWIEGSNAFVKAIPIIGEDLAKSGDNIAELFVNSNRSIRESNEEIKRQLALEGSLNDLLKQQKGILDEIARLRTPSGERGRYDIEKERADRLAALGPKEEEARWLKEQGDINGYNKLISEIHDRKVDIDNAYLLKMEAPFVNAIDAADLQIKKLEEGERAAELYQLSLSGDWNAGKERQLTKKWDRIDALKNEKKATQELAEARDALLKAEVGEAEFNRLKLYARKDLTMAQKMEKEELDRLTRSQEEYNDRQKNYADVVKNLRDELATYGKDRYDKMLYDLQQRGATPGEIGALMPAINELRSLAVEKKYEPLRGWQPFESMTMTGIRAPEIATDYNAKTANNTQRICDLLVQLTSILNQITTKSNPDIVILDRI